MGAMDPRRTFLKAPSKSIERRGGHMGEEKDEKKPKKKGREGEEGETNKQISK